MVGSERLSQDKKSDMNKRSDYRPNQEKLAQRLPSIRRKMAELLLYKTISKLLIKEMYIKLTKCRRRINRAGEVGEKMGKAKGFFLSMREYNRFAVEQCRATLSSLAEKGITNVSVYGANDIAEILYDLTYELPVTITAIYDECPKAKPWGPPVLPLEARQNGQEVIILAAVVGIEEKVKRLSRLGTSLENLVVMGR